MSALSAQDRQAFCQSLDRNHPTFSSIQAEFDAGDDEALSLAAIRCLRARKTPDLGYSRAWVEEIRAAATPAQVEEARTAIAEALAKPLIGTIHGNPVAMVGAEKLQIGWTPAFSRDLVASVIANREQWAGGTWGIVAGACHLLRALWPVEEFADADALPILCWIREQIVTEWGWARTWDEVMLGNSGHNWWLHTFMGFWMAGTFFPEIEGLARFRAFGDDYLHHEMKLLIAEDGFTEERTFGYHLGTLRLFMGFAELAERNGHILSAEFKERLLRIANSTWRMVAPDGNMPEIGDGIGRPGLMFDQLRVVAAYFQQPHAKFVLERLDPDWQPTYSGVLSFSDRNLLSNYQNLRSLEPPLDATLPDSGYYIMRDAWQRDSSWAFVDAGPRGSIVTSHDHTAVLNFELYSHGSPIIVDNGSGPYGTEPSRSWRVSSAAHNVCTVDGEDHIPILNEWRWGSLIAPVIDNWISQEEFAYLSAAHEGYARLPNPVPGYRRKMLYVRGRYWVLIDRFTPADDATHRYEQFFHILPPAELGADGRVVTNGEGGNLLIIPVARDTDAATLSANPHPLEKYRNPQTLKYEREAAGRQIMVTVMVPFQGNTVPDVEIVQRSAETEDGPLSPWQATALDIHIDNCRDFYFDQHMHWNLPWRCDNHCGEGRLAYVHRTS